MNWHPTPGSLADQRRVERETRGRRIASEHLAYMRALLAGDNPPAPSPVDDHEPDHDEDF